MVTHTLAIDKHLVWIHDVVNVRRRAFPLYSLLEHGIDRTMIGALGYISLA